MVYFVGAGAGDPELLTVKGKRLIDNADTIIYAGSLVNPAVLADRRPDCQVYDSAGMTLEEVLAVMQETEAQGKMTVRVHTGDASIYGAIREQLDALDKLGIPHTVVPGVSSFLAAAAAMQKEYTLPDVTQTVILTRMEGRTPVPERERLEELAKHRATMIIFLSVGRIGLGLHQRSNGTHHDTCRHDKHQCITVCKRPPHCFCKICLWFHHAAEVCLQLFCQLFPLRCQPEIRRFHASVPFRNSWVNVLSYSFDRA